MNRIFKIIFKYLLCRLKIILAFLLFMLIFLAIYYLYDLPLDPILYSSIFVCSVALIFSIYDFSKYSQKHLQLLNLTQNININIHSLPEPSNLLEEDYQQLLQILYQNYTDLISQTDQNFTDMLNYYTMWAHQIKTPISALNLLLQAEQPESHLAEMKQELFKVEQYVSMVLQYLRLESLSSDLTLQEYSLEKMVRQAVKKYASIFIYKKISIHLSNLDSMVLTDEKWFSFVLEQLLSNALKYTPQGSISLYLEPNQDKVLVIADTGIGIRSEDVPRIFERGFTGYNGRMDQKSTGIGLYLCKQILNRLSHQITVSSELGKGTQVKIDLSSEKLELDRLADDAPSVLANK